VLSILKVSSPQYRIAIHRTGILTCRRHHQRESVASARCACPLRASRPLLGAVRSLRAPIAPEDKPLVADSFERLTEESRYRRFFTTKNELSPAELAYLVDVDLTDHEAIIAIDPSTGEALGVARYVRSKDDG
jgi:hypothetical protein